MITSINGKEAEWPAEVWDLWFAKMANHDLERFPVERSNYFTPRPEVDQYNRASPYEGFCYVLGRNVMLVEWRPRG